MASGSAINKQKTDVVISLTNDRQYKIYMLGKDAEVHPFVRMCQSEYESYFGWAIIVIEGAMLAFGAFLSWEIRHVKIDALNDSHQIGLCLYSVVILSAVGLTLSLLLNKQLVTMYDVTSECIIIGTIATLMCVLSGNTVAEQCGSSTSSSVGREFIFGILANLNAYIIPQTKVTLYIVGESTGSLTLEIPFLGINRAYSITAGSVLSLPINSTIQADGTFQGYRGIRLTSSTDISVLVTNFIDCCTMASYLVFPVNSSGKHYLVSSYTPWTGSGYNSRLLVVGVSDNTHVTMTYENVINITLNRQEVYQFQVSYDKDLTGSVLTSDKNVVVISGTGNAEIPAGFLDAGHLAAQMIPTDIWTKLYIIPPLTPKKAFMIRILTETPTVNVTFTNRTTSFTVTPTSTTDYFFGTDSLVISADAPVGVVQYGVSNQYDHVAGDPFMTLVPGISQYINKYTFSVPRPDTVFSHHVAVIVQSDHITGLLMDGANVQIHSSVQVVSPLHQYTVLTSNVSEGYHTMSHRNTTVTFGLLVYGLKAKTSLFGYGYGFYAGINFKGECTESTTSTHSIPSTTSTESTVTAAHTTKETTVTMTAELTTPQHNASGQIMCYECDDISHLELCDAVQSCTAEQTCYVERYQTTTGTKFKSGCMDFNRCGQMQTMTNNSNGCLQCCHNNYCNNIGCGDSGLPSRDQRGPVCFDCQHVVNTTECRRVTVCASNEVCSIEVFKWPDHFHYKLGCVSQLCNPTSRSLHHRAARATLQCHSCCENDYCNQSCTSQEIGFPGIVVG